jgi:hypothetical protein
MEVEINNWYGKIAIAKDIAFGEWYTRKDTEAGVLDG